jgi:hypothetical protein
MRRYRHTQAIVLLVLCVSGSQAAQVSASKALHFPRDRSMGMLKDLDRLSDNGMRPSMHWWWGQLTWKAANLGKAFVQLGKHPCLERIRIYTGQFTDKGLEHLSALPHLRQLHIPNNQGFTDAGLKHLAKLTHLEDLYLRGRLFTRAGMAELRGLKKLKKVKFLTPSADAAAFSRTHGRNE